MATSSDKPVTPQGSTYVIDAESAAEMARLMRQEQLITQEMGELLQEEIDLTNVHSILDVACGPGGWALEMAFAHTDIEITGVDISQTMIAYAQAQARVQGLNNAHFRVMNALKPLQFPDNSFDIVNVRMILTFMLPDVWPHFLKECLRILKPGGVLRISDFEWGGFNKFAVEKFVGLLNQAMAKQRQSFSPTGQHLGLLAVLRQLVQYAGFERIQKKAYILETSYGTPTHEGFYHDLAAAFRLLQPFIVNAGGATQEELESLYQQALIEMQSEDYCGVAFFMSVWGYKPVAE